MVIDEWCERFSGRVRWGRCARWEEGKRAGRERSDVGGRGRGLDTDGEDWGKKEG